MSTSRRIGPWIAGVAAAGAVVGHAVTYAVVQPDAVARQSLLAATGHAWVHLANDAGAVLAIVALAAALLGRITKREAGISAEALFRRLAVFQVLAFVGMEVAERSTVGASLGGVFADGLLPIGVAVQVVVAAVAAIALRHLVRSIDGLAAAGSPIEAPARTSTPIRVPVERSRSALALAASSIRAPPVLAR